MRWDPTQYARYSDHRSRPFFDLVAQIGAESPGTVIDVGCGSGELTVTLAQRWPTTTLLGLDSSPQMIGGAPVGPGGRLHGQGCGGRRRNRRRRPGQQRSSAVGAAAHRAPHPVGRAAQ